MSITDEAVEAFKKAWHEADAKGDEGNRVLRGLAAAGPIIAAEALEGVRCCDPSAVRERIEGTWLVEEHQHHTCGTGDHGDHEPGCGLVPLMDLRGLPGWESLARGEES